MKITKCSLLLISLILCSTTSTAATVRWDLKPSHFICGDGVFAGSHQGNISGWFQFDAANPLDNSRYSFVFQTTTVSEIPTRGYTYSSFNDERGHPTGTINLVDATAFTIIGFVLIQNLEFRFPLTYQNANGVTIPVSVQEVVGDLYEGKRYASTIATMTTVPLSSSNSYFLIGLSILLFYQRIVIQKSRHRIPPYIAVARVYRNAQD